MLKRNSQQPRPLSRTALSSTALYRLMQRHELSVEALARLTGYRTKVVLLWLVGTRKPPLYLRTVIEHQDKYKKLLPRELHEMLSVKRSSNTKFQRPLPKVD